MNILWFIVGMAIGVTLGVLGMAVVACGKMQEMMKEEDEG